MPKRWTLVLTVVLLIGLTSRALAQTAPDPNFNPNYIIGDEDIVAFLTMSVSDIQSFLTSKGGALADYTCLDPDGRSWTAAQAIYNVAIANRINPKFILVLLQKEQGLIEDSSPKASQYDWATGYGCPDSGGCNERWRGFWKQINSASLQFRDYLENPNLYKYQVGQAYTFTNPYSVSSKDPVVVTPANKGTAALYNYTPHVYNGNYNFWLLWRRYFGQSYPDGSLLQGKGQPGVWLLENGRKRAFLAYGALISRFDPKTIIQVDPQVLTDYPTGAPIKFPQYSIARAPDKTLYLLVDNSKRPFASQEAFKKLGYNPAEVIEATDNDLAGYANGAPITATEAYPTGALLRAGKRRLRDIGSVHQHGEVRCCHLPPFVVNHVLFDNQGCRDVVVRYCAGFLVPCLKRDEANRILAWRAVA